MAAKTYTVMNGAAVTNSAVTAIATNSAIRTMFQLLLSANTAVRIVEYWTEFDGSAAATPIKCELISHTGGAQTSLTTYAAADIAPANDPNAANSDLVLGSSSSGFSSQTTEVAPSGTVRNLRTDLVAPTAGIYIQYPLGREPEVKVSTYARSRVTNGGTSVNCLTGVTFEA